jgi:hypothetical protein
MGEGRHLMSSSYREIFGEVPQHPCERFVAGSILLLG